MGCIDTKPEVRELKARTEPAKENQPERAYPENPEPQHQGSAYNREKKYNDRD
jgi:hypothetical protein